MADRIVGGGRLSKQRPLRTSAEGTTTPSNRWGQQRGAPLRARARRALPYVCAVAGCGHDQHLELDHVQPLAEGGADDLSNCAWMCRPHHQAKTLAEAARGRQRAIARRGSLSKRYRDREKHPGELP